MQEHQQEWAKQFFANYGRPEFFRSLFAFLGCMLIGLVLNIKYDNIGYSPIFQAIAWGFPVTAAFWQPAYKIFHKILGNNNIPVAIFKRNWWEYITLAILVPIPVAMFFRGLQMVFK